MVVVVTRSSASSGPMSGIGRSSNSIRPGATNTAAFMKRDMALLLAISVDRSQLLQLALQSVKYVAQGGIDVGMAGGGFLAATHVQVMTRQLQVDFDFERCAVPLVARRCFHHN